MRLVAGDPHLAVDHDDVRRRWGPAEAAGTPAALQEPTVASAGDGLPCDLSGYDAGDGPLAAMDGNTLLVTRFVTAASRSPRR